MLLNGFLSINALNLGGAFVVDLLELVGSALDVVQLGALFVNLLLIETDKLIRKLRVLGLEHHLVIDGLLAGVSFLLHELDEGFLAQGR